MILLRERERSIICMEGCSRISFYTGDVART